MTRKKGPNKMKRMNAVAAFRQSIKDGSVVKIDQAEYAADAAYKAKVDAAKAAFAALSAKLK